jgi:hypothetical protein
MEKGIFRKGLPDKNEGVTVEEYALCNNAQIMSFSS